MPRPLLPVLLLACLIAGCSAPGVPSQSHPSCSWAMSPPSNADRLCSTAFHTLADLATAVSRDDESRIRSIVPNRIVADRIIYYSRDLKRQGKPSVHIVPSLTLDITSKGSLGAGFYLIGTTRKGRVKAPQTLYLRVQGTRASVVGDQPDQEW